MGCTMSDPAARDVPMTIADYEALLEARTGDERFELIRGRIVMVTNLSEEHGQIVANLFAPLEAATDAAGCRAYAGGMAVQRSEERGDDMVAIPDVLVRCGPRRGLTFVTDPLVVVEVLSRSTMHVDRGAKFDVDRSLPTLQHVAFVYQRQMRVEHDRRAGEGWRLHELVRPSDRVDFDATDFSTDLDTVYLGVPALHPLDAPDEGEPG